MRLNESKLIAEIKRLAEQIAIVGDDESKGYAGGIISICNILDADITEPQPLQQPFTCNDIGPIYSQKEYEHTLKFIHDSHPEIIGQLGTTAQNDIKNMFDSAREEQQGVS